MLTSDRSNFNNILESSTGPRSDPVPPSKLFIVEFDAVPDIFVFPSIPFTACVNVTVPVLSLLSV